MSNIISNKYSTCSMCGNTFVYKKKDVKRCVFTKHVYEYRCPKCNYVHTKKQIKSNKINLVSQ